MASKSRGRTDDTADPLAEGMEMIKLPLTLRHIVAQEAVVLEQAMQALWRVVSESPTQSGSSAVCLISNPDDEFQPWLEIGRHFGRIQAESHAG